MVKKYWIPNSNLYKGRASEKTNAMIKYQENNIVEVERVEDMQSLIADIQAYEYVTDEKIKGFFDANFPDIKIKGVPIDIQELKNKFRSIFSDVPDSFFEEADAVKLLKKAINLFFIKKETRFIILNTMNGSLEWKDEYHHPPTIEFYFRMKKICYDLDEYYQTITDIQKIIQRAILKQICYPDDKCNIGRKELSLIERGINLSGRFFIDFEEKLDLFKSEIKDKKRFTKQALLALPFDYEKIEEQALEKINETIKDVKERQEGVDKTKEMIRKEIQNRKGIIPKGLLKILYDVALERFL